MKFFHYFLIGLIACGLFANFCQAQGSAAGEDPLEDEGNVESEGSEHAEKVPPASSESATADSGPTTETPNTEQPKRNLTEEFYKLPKSMRDKLLQAIVEEELRSLIGPSEHVQLSYVFVSPPGVGQVGRTLDLPTGKNIKMAIHMQNKGENTFHVDIATAAFRYPMDMSYVIQNFSTVRFHGQDVESGREASFVYQFYADPQLATRSFGLTVQLGYRDAGGKSYLHSAINQTVSLYEPDEGFDGETFFMYIFLVVLAVLAVAGIWYLLKTYTPAKKLGKGRSRPKAEAANNGIAGSADYDIDWIPQKHLDIKNRRASGKQSPRQTRSPNKISASEGNASD